MNNEQLKKSLGKIAILNDLLEKELTTLNPIKRINNLYSMSLLDGLLFKCKKVTKHFDKAFGIKAEDMGDIFDEIDKLIDEKISYD